MHILHGLEAITRNPQLYLGNRSPCAGFLTSGLVDQIIRSGVAQVKIRVHDGGWTSVSAERDWILPGLRRRNVKDYAQPFAGLYPFDGGEQNEIRFEAILGAFALSISVKMADTYELIKGAEVPQAAKSALLHEPFAVVFQSPGGDWRRTVSP